jgi:hypothetical protein
VALSAGHVENRILQLQSEKADEGEAIAKSVWSSERLESACDTSALKLTTSSQGLIPRLHPKACVRFVVAKLAFHQRRL